MAWKDGSTKKAMFQRWVAESVRRQAKVSCPSSALQSAGTSETLRSLFNKECHRLHVKIINVWVINKSIKPLQLFCKEWRERGKEQTCRGELISVVIHVISYQHPSLSHLLPFLSRSQNKSCPWRRIHAEPFKLQRTNISNELYIDVWTKPTKITLGFFKFMCPCQ